MSDAITPEILDRYIAEVFKPRKRPAGGVGYVVDWSKMVEHEIRHGFDCDGTMLFSAEEMRRAKETGALRRNHSFSEGRG